MPQKPFGWKRHSSNDLHQRSGALAQDGPDSCGGLASLTYQLDACRDASFINQPAIASTCSPRLALSISISCSIARAPEQRNDKTDTLPKMPNPWDYTYASPLAGFEDAPPLSTDTNDDGKSLVNPPRDGLSEAYRSFAWPLKTDRRGGFDIHVYYLQQNPEQAKYARELWERIRREFPELRVYKFWDVPVGPHPVAMFEVNVFTPAQFGAFVAWLAIWRGPLSALIHPNTTVHPGEAANEVELRDHTERAIWMGERLPLDWAPFRPQSHE